ncbi:MAG: hypothetical protein SNJ69_09610 [Chloroflexaceae bacterium]
MRDCVVTLTAELRVWQDERLGRRWRVAYREGDEETVVSFPDTEALGDFIAERFGLTLLDHSEPALLAA